MKLFGEYLIEKGLVDERSLVEALIEQLKKLPSTAEIVHELGLLSPNEILRVFKFETSHGTSFIEAARSLKVWSDGADAALNAHLKKLRVPVGQILVSRGVVNTDKMTKALDDFLGDWSEQAGKPVAATPVPSSSTQSAPPAAKESLAGSSATAEYCLQEFSNERLKGLGIFFDGMVMSLPTVDELKAQSDVVHLLRGAARLLSATQLGAVLESCESMFERFQKLLQNNAASLDIDTTGRIALLGADVVTVIKYLVDALNTSGSEESVVADDSKSATLNDVVQSLGKINETLKSKL